VIPSSCAALFQARRTAPRQERGCQRMQEQLTVSRVTTAMPHAQIMDQDAAWMAGWPGVTACAVGSAAKMQPRTIAVGACAPGCWVARADMQAPCSSQSGCTLYDGVGCLSGAGPSWMDCRFTMVVTGSLVGAGV